MMTTFGEQGLILENFENIYRIACRSRRLWDNRRGLGTRTIKALAMLHKSHLKLHQDLGIPADYGLQFKLPFYEESGDLIEVGPNLVGRMQRLTPAAAARWQQMVEAASRDGVRLLIVSGFRSFEYQAQLIRGKLEAGQNILEILKVNAAPGYSEHHTGCAVDIATPGSRPLMEEFESSDAFAWLLKNAGTCGFSMTYPRDNAFGFIYEPWHWAQHSGKSG
jgi:D-alanyl-D-alanine carboxypeptidase